MRHPPFAVGQIIFQERQDCGTGTEHPAQYPEELIERIIKVGTNPGDLVLDPFMGSGTTAAVAKRLGRKYVGYELEEEYIKIAKKRLEDGDATLF